MLLRVVGATDSVEIDEPVNFKAFAVRLEGPFASPVAEAALLDRIAVSRDDDHAWISEDVLRAWPSLTDAPWWGEGLTTMIASVERFGWVDRTKRAVRAHIERT